MREETVNRIGSMFFGLFLFFFGLPFTLVPLMMFSWGEIDPDYPFESLLMIIFSIPFLMAGLLVQFFGLKMISGGLGGTADTTPIPRELPPGTGQDWIEGSNPILEEMRRRRVSEDESNSEGWWTEK
jgi:hypothetical protein